MARSMTSPPTSTLAIYRDAVAERMLQGEPFGTIEEAIDEVSGLSQDQKAALWLFAFSLRDSTEQRLAAQAHLAALQ
jgi:hypothetical protein